MAFGISEIAGNPSIQVDYISSLTGGANVDFLSPITTASSITATGNVSAANLIASGDVNVGNDLTVTNDLTLLNNRVRVPSSNGLNVVGSTDTAGRPIKVNGAHIGGTYTGSNPAPGEILTSGIVDVDIKPGGTTALTLNACLLYTSPSPRDKRQSRMPSSA